MMSMEWTKGSTGDIGIFTHKRFVLRAQALIHFERYSEALICLEASLTAAPEYGPAQYFKGQVLEKLGQLQEAIQSYELASADPTCFEAAKAAAAQIYLDLGQFEQGAHLWFEVWMKNPGNMASWSRWKHYCEQTGKPMLVLECFEQLAALQTLSAEMMVDWGRTWASAGRHGEAIKCFAEAMRIEPTYANAYFNCGDVLYQTDAPGRAIEMYRAGLALLPDYAEGWFVFGNALAKYGREQESIRAFETALELAPDHAGAIHNLTVLRAA
jgi:tetratricopeptide (TPR) repeat protein